MYKEGVTQVIDKYSGMHVVIILGKNVTIEPNVIIGYGSIQKKREPNEQTPKLNLKEVVIGDNTIIRSGSIIYAGVKIGNNCMINNYVIIRENTLIGDGTVISDYTKIEGYQSIGKNCSITTHCHLTAYMSIGDNVFIAPHFIGLNDPVIGYKREILHKDRIIKGPQIEDNVRISAGVIVQPGIKIGRESILGTGTVVTKDVPEGSVVLGVPGKVVKQVPKEHYYVA